MGSGEHSVHGVMMDIHGVGVLIFGKSGIGKSEIALDLLSRGHRLVSDDRVYLAKSDHNSLVASGSAITHHMEIRGLGILDIRALFGVTSIRREKRIHLVVQLLQWDDVAEIDRIGLEREYWEYCGISIDQVRIPVHYGRNIASIIEVAALNHLLKLEGHESARDLNDALIRSMTTRQTDPPDPTNIEERKGD